MILEALLLKYSFLIFVLGAIFVFLICLKSKVLSIIASSIFAIIASSLSLISSIFSIIYQHPFAFALTYNLGFPLGKIELVIDPLSAFFIMIISILVIPVSIYSIGYLKKEYIEKNVGILGFLYQLFILSMLLVVCSGNGFQFLIFWELMTLISFAFVISDITNSDSQKAGFIYLLMTHIGSAFLLFTFLIFAKYTGSFSFTSFHGISNAMPDWLKLTLFLFILIGFGTKAGIIPLHIWLPEAHPAAPSHISALMSGVMIKTGIYGILRFVFDFLSPFPYWWGILLGMIAIITAILGIIFASSESNIKRILAYSSIENIGIILLPIGASMIFFGFGQKELAALTLIPALFHSLNHSLFKGLLFTSVGAVISVTHIKNIEKLGGLIKVIPKTAFLFLIGALSISAFPPFNGFISKWLTFQSLLLLFQLKSETIKLLAPIAASLLGFVSAISAATFVKTFSGIFLGMPRTHKSINAQEATPSMILSMSILALLCLLIGIFPNIPFSLIKTITYSIIGLDSASITAFNNLPGFNNLFISPALVFILLIATLCLTYIVVNNLGSKIPIRKDETWSCGVKPKSEFGHTPKGFSQPLNVIFSELHTPESFYHDYIYLPITNGLMSLSHKIKPLQSGILQIDLFYIFLTLIVCLVWLRL